MKLQLSVFRFAVLPLLMLVAGPAFGHAHVTSTTPSKDSVVHESPTKVVLVFSEPLEVEMSNVEVTSSPEGIIQSQGTVSSPDAKHMTLEIGLSTLKNLPAKIKVTWKAVAKDTHKMKGEFAFTYQPSAPTK